MFSDLDVTQIVFPNYLKPQSGQKQVSVLFLLQVCSAGHLMERAGHWPVSLWGLPAGSQFSGGHLSAPLPAVWLFDSCSGSGGCALCLPRDARE